MSPPLKTDVHTASLPPWHAYGVLALGIGAVSLAAIFIRLAQSDGVPSLLIAAFRLTLAALVLTPFTLRRYREQLRRLQPRDLLLALASGFFLALHFATWIASLEYTTVLISVVLVTTSPLWVALLEVLFLHARLGRMVIFGLALAFSGGLLIAVPSGSVGSFPTSIVQSGSGWDILLAAGSAAGAGSAPLLGGALALLGAVAVAVYLVIGRKLRAGLDLLPYIWLVYGSGALVLLLVLFIVRTPVTGYPEQSYLWLVLLGIFPQLIGHSSFNYALRFLQATYVSVATQLEPIFSAIVAFFVFRETPGTLQLLGSAVILTGVLVATLGQGRRETAVTASTPETVSAAQP